MKSFFLQSCLFIICIYILQSLIVFIFPPKIPQSAINFKESLRRNNDQIDIVYFADSTLYTSDSRDNIPAPISQFLEKSLNNAYTIGIIDHAANQPDAYAAYATYLSRLQHQPKYLIVEINMRVFSPIWDQQPAYQFEEEKLYYTFFADTPFMPLWPFFSNSGFINLYPVSDASFKNTPVFNGTKQIGLMKDFQNDRYNACAKNNMENMIQVNYMYNLSRDHRKIQSLLKITDVISYKDTEIIFYFTPIDYQTGEAYLGKQFTYQLRKNVAMVTSALQEKNITILDISTSLPTENFTWQQNIYVNEHLNEYGRRFVARKLGETILKSKKN